MVDPSGASGLVSSGVEALDFVSSAGSSVAAVMVESSAGSSISTARALSEGFAAVFSLRLGEGGARRDKDERADLGCLGGRGGKSGPEVGGRGFRPREDLLPGTMVSDAL